MKAQEKTMSQLAATEINLVCGSDGVYKTANPSTAIAAKAAMHEELVDALARVLYDHAPVEAWLKYDKLFKKADAIDN